MNRKGRPSNASAGTSQPRSTRSRSVGPKSKGRGGNRSSSIPRRQSTNGQEAGIGNSRSTPGENAQNRTGGRYEDSSKFTEMMRKHSKFFKSRIFNNPTHLELADEEFRCLLNDVLQSESDNNELRHQFLIKLCKTNVLEMEGPICRTLMMYVQKRVNLGNRTGHLMVENLKMIVQLLSEILIRMPHFENVHAKCAAINGLINVIPGAQNQLRMQLTELEERLTDPSILMNKVNDPCNNWSADLSFIGEPIIPDLEVFMQGSLHSRYQNIIKGRYQSQEYYLETWFKLMQEDFLSPVRTAIKDFKHERRMKPGCTQMRLDGGYYYRFQNVLKTANENGMVLYQLKFNLDNLKHIDWSSSDRLRSESLIFLSNDNFKTAYYATIQKLRELPEKRGTVWVTMLDGRLPLRSNFDGVEAMPFFVPYQCVLERLKYLAALVQKSVDLPMQNYIVKCQKDVQPPKYMKGAPLLTMPNGRKARPGDVKNVCLNLDQSQTSAMELALTNELAIIQGPPGCGKSYVGAILVDILMRNTEVWQTYGHGVIMLMAYTNHAIDQFITECEGRGIDMSKTVRLGGRGNEQMQKYMMFNKRQELSKWFEYKEIVREAKQYYRAIKEKDREISAIEAILKRNYEEFTYSDYSSYIAPPFQDQMIMYHGTVNESLIIRWLNSDTNGRLDFTNAIIMSLDEAVQLQNSDIFSLSKGNRIRLFKFWCEWAKLPLQNHLERSKMERNHLKGIYEVYRRQQDIAVVRRCNIIAMTTTGASKHSHLVEAVKPTIVLVEEAAEVIESHLVAPLTTGCKHLILIGDHQQLRPSIAEFQLEERNMAISLFERLITNEIPNRRLDTQHRMHPEIAHILVPHIYPTLNHHQNVYMYPEVMGIPKRMVFLTHEHMEKQTGEKSSKSNEFEAEFLVHLARYLLLQGYDSEDITILTTYSGQMRLVNTHIDRMRTFKASVDYGIDEQLEAVEETLNDLTINENPKTEIIHQENFKTNLKDIRVTTVDNYQGEESKIILLSFVRSNHRGDIGFLKWSNRICVALSRAKYGFYAVGNFKLFAKNRKSDLWKKLCKQLEERGNLKTTMPIACKNHNILQQIATVGDFQKLAPEGGCQKVCDQELVCGHTCTRKCHPYDQLHKTFKCRVPCSGRLSCGHECLIECFKPGDSRSFFFVRDHFNAEFRKCPQCEKDLYCGIVVTVIPPSCGHEGSSQCSDVNKYTCQKIIPFDLTCGHQKKAPCTSDPEALKRACRKQVTEILPCKHVIVRPCNTPNSICSKLTEKMFPTCLHTVMAPCHRSIDDLNCTTLVDKQMKCGHILKVKCHVSETPQVCTEKIDVTLSCGHEQRVSCHEGTNVPCITVMKKELPCKHSVDLRCGQSTPYVVCSQKVTFTVNCGRHELETTCNKKTEEQSKPCSKKVEKLLSCGHKQIRLCKEAKKPCMEMIMQKRTGCQHSIRTNCHKLETEMKKPCAIRTSVKRNCGHYVQVPCKHVQDPFYANVMVDCAECVESNSDTEETEDTKEQRTQLGLSVRQGTKLLQNEYKNVVD